jgi:mono/diheme cytochrome c family protein
MRMLILWAIIGLLTGLEVAGTSGVGLAQGQGQNIYQDKCAICHGADGKGNGPAAAALSPSPADFTTASFWQNTSNAKITDTIENGHGPMPAFDLSPRQIKAVIDYMSRTFKPGS